MLFVQRRPATDRLSPFVGDFRKQADAGAHVFAALGVMRGSRQHRVRPMRLRVAGSLMEFRHAPAKLAGIAADHIECDQPVEAIIRRVLNALSHGRAGQLLKTHHKFAGCLRFSFQ